MTYCLGIVTKHGLVMAADSRTNAGYDQVNTTRKMHTFVQQSERVFVILTSGSLSCTQSVLTLLRKDWDKGKGLAAVPSLYDAARIIGETVRNVAQLDREALERDEYRFNVHLLLGGQVRGEPPGVYLIYPQGNPLQATEDSPYLQIGETKYGRPILIRGYERKMSFEDAAKLLMVSFDSTLKANLSVGLPLDLMVIERDCFEPLHSRRIEAGDPYFEAISSSWSDALRNAFHSLPDYTFETANPT
jgi:putative proteasome-type protease